jgi:hypothetical protein
MSFGTALVDAPPSEPLVLQRKGANMSSGPFTYSLGGAAAYVLRSLMDHPDRQTAEEIAGAASAGDEIDAGAARGGLGELGARGLAAEDSDGRWHLTDAGREAKQPA